MKCPLIISLLINQQAPKISLFNTISFFALLTASMLIVKNCYADDELWQFNHIFQTYLQPYENTPDRKNTSGIGYYLSADYLDSGNIAFSYNSTLVKLSNNADVTENLFYLSGQYHLYPDSLPGKLSLRLDSYFGDYTLQYNITIPPPTIPGPSPGPSGPGPGPKMSNANTRLANPDIIEEKTDINILYSQLSFIDYKKTYYANIGYAYSEYDGSSKTVAIQITPTFSFSWNDSYDWLQLRAYFVELEQTASTYADDHFESLEVKYTHWIPDELPSSLELFRFSMLSGNRVLAVDPDTSSVYSITDIQKVSVSGSAQWKYSENLKILALLQYDQYQNSAVSGDYEGYLFYINLQFKN